MSARLRPWLLPRRLMTAGGVLLLIGFPFVFSSLLATEFLTWSLFGLSFNLLLGYTGLLSFGHALFFGMGAYGLALSVIYLQTPMPVALALAVSASALTALLVGMLSIHRGGIYFAMLTLASAQVFYFVVLSWTEFTGGDNGLSLRGIPVSVRRVASWQLDSPTAFYYFVLAIFLVAALFLWRLTDSPFGRVIQGIRENELRVRCLGLHVERFKLVALTISGALSGLAGAINVIQVQYVHPNLSHWSVSGEVIIISLVGGSQSFFGPVVGAAVFVFLSDYLSRFWDRWILVLGVIFVVVTLYMRGGIVGALDAGRCRWTSWIARRRRGAPLKARGTAETARR